MRRADGTMVCRTGATGHSSPGSCAAWPRRQRSSSSGPSTSQAPTTRQGSHPAWRTPLSMTRTSWCSPSPRPLTAIVPAHLRRFLRKASSASRKGLVVLAPAGNDGSSRRMWPAAHPGVIAVGRAGRELAGTGVVHQFRPVGRCLRAGRESRQRLPRGNLRVQRAAQRRGTPAVPRDGDMERDVVQHPGGRRADRRPDVPDRGERPAGRRCAAAFCLQPGDPRRRPGALPRPGLLWPTATSCPNRRSDYSDRPGMEQC